MFPFYEIGSICVMIYDVKLVVVGDSISVLYDDRIRFRIDVAMIIRNGIKITNLTFDSWENCPFNLQENGN